VSTILKAHARRGDRWAGPDCIVYCIGAATVPVVLIALLVQDYAFR
jgi:hypothetical protein